MSNQEKQENKLEYNITSTIWYVQALKFIIIIVIGKRQKSWRLLLKKQWHVQKYSPRVHKLRGRSALSRSSSGRKSTAFVGKSCSREDRQQKCTSCEAMGTISLKLSLWKPGEDCHHQRDTQYIWTVERKDTADHWRRLLTDQTAPNL